MAKIVPAPVDNVATEVVENLPVLGKMATVVNDTHGEIRETLTSTAVASAIADTSSRVVETAAIGALALGGGGAILTGISSSTTLFSYLMSVGFSLWQSLLYSISQGMLLVFSFLSAPFLVLPRRKKGKVIDQQTRNGVYKALVIFTREDGYLKILQTDHKGEFDLPEEGDYLVRVERKGYWKLEKELVNPTVLIFLSGFVLTFINLQTIIQTKALNRPSFLLKIMLL